MNAAQAHKIVGLSMLWLGFLVLASRNWSAVASSEGRSTREVIRDFVQGKAKGGGK